jgi:hypothetical protein
MRALGIAMLALAAVVATAAPARAIILPAQGIDGPSGDIVDVGGVAMSADGTGGVVYRKRVSGRAHIFVAELYGGKWRAPQRVDVGQSFDSSWPVIGAGDGGRLVVVWVQEFGAGTDRLFSASLDPGATQFQAPVAVDLNVGESTATYPSIAMNPGGAAYLAYRVPTEAGSNQNVLPGHLDMDTRVARYNGSLWSVLGSPADRNQSLPVRTPTAANSPRVGIDVAGNGLVAFQEPDEDLVDRIWARRIFGLTFGIPLAVSPHEFGGAPLRGDADAFSLVVAGFGQGAVAFRQQPGQGSALTGAHVFVNTIPEAFSDTASQFAGARLADGTTGGAPPANPGEPSVGVTPDGVFQVAYSLGAAGRMVGGDDTQVLAPSALGDGRGAVDSTPAVAVAKDGAAVVAWRARSSVVAVEELRASGAYTVRGVSSAAGGAVSDLLTTGSGIGDGLVGFLQGSGAGARVEAALVDAPPLDFAVQVPLKFIRSRRPLISWDPAENSLAKVRYTVRVGGRMVARDIAGTSFRLGKNAKLRDGRWKVIVTAIDGDGQHRTGTSATLRIDRRAPRVRIARHGTKVTVRVVDGRKGRVAGVRGSSVRVSFGDGKRGGGKARLEHRYNRRGSFRIAVRASDKAGNRVTAKRRVSVR